MLDRETLVDAPDGRNAQALGAVAGRPYAESVQEDNGGIGAEDEQRQFPELPLVVLYISG
jgi:hypothetical protein